MKEKYILCANIFSAIFRKGIVFVLITIKNKIALYKMVYHLVGVVGIGLISYHFASCYGYTEGIYKAFCILLFGFLINHFN